MSGYGVAYLLVAVGSAAMALAVGSGAEPAWLRVVGVLVWCWSSLGSLIPAVAYLLGRADWLGKRSDGSIAQPLRLALWSYVVVNYVAFVVHAWGKGERPWDEVVPGIWVGRRPRRAERKQLAELAPAAILDLTAEHPHRGWLARRDVVYLNIPVVDGAAPTAQQIDTAVAFLDTAPRPVLVHCALGHGRSATVVAAWMLWAGVARDSGDAERIMQEARPWVHIRYKQHRAIVAWARREGLLERSAG